MSKGKGWDLTSTNSLQGAAQWIQKNSGALFVLVLRENDAAFAIAPHMTAGRVMEILNQEQVALHQHLVDHQIRKEKVG